MGEVVEEMFRTNESVYKMFELKRFQRPNLWDQYQVYSFPTHIFKLLDQYGLRLLSLEKQTLDVVHLVVELLVVVQFLL